MELASLWPSCFPMSRRARQRWCSASACRFWFGRVVGGWRLMAERVSAWFSFAALSGVSSGP